MLTSGSSAAGYIRNFDDFGEIKIFDNSEKFFEISEKKVFRVFCFLIINFLIIVFLSAQYIL